MSLQLVTPPAVEPVALADAKAHLKVDTADDDTLIASLVTAARARAEWLTGRAFITQSWMLWRDAWPPAPFEIPLPPLQTLTSITTYDLGDTATVLDSALYRVDASANPARVAWTETVVPPTNLRNLNALAVAFTAGYGDAATDVPEPIRQAILEMVAQLYANRGDAAGEIPRAAQALLAPYRVLQV
jgi:uncharacterized phiE125 gp8 family phage protein